MDHWRYYLHGRLLELFGLKPQAIAAECERRCWHLVETIEDAGYSARDLRRPGIQEALRALPAFPRASNRAAFVLAALERFEEAEALFRRTLALEPNNAVAHFNLGYTHDKRGQYHKAIEEFRAATRLNPKIDRAWYGLGLAHAQLGQHREAAEALEQAATLQPMNHHAWYQLGMALHLTGNAERFMQVVMHLLRFDPKMTRRLILDSGRSDLAHLVQHLVV